MIKIITSGAVSLVRSISDIYGLIIRNIGDDDNTSLVGVMDYGDSCIIVFDINCYAPRLYPTIRGQSINEWAFENNFIVDRVFLNSQYCQISVTI